MDNRRKIKPLILLVLAFALPVLLAQLWLSQSWYQGAATNRGELMSPAVNFDELNINNPSPGKWQLLYQVGSDCDELCLNQIKLMHQSYVALGRKQERVQLLLFKDSSMDLDSQLDMQDWHELNLLEGNYPLAQLPAKRLMIADPLGNIMMSYELGNDPNNLTMINRDMLIDLRKLLKLSKVG